MEKVIQERLVELDQYEKNLVKMIFRELLSQEKQKARQELIERIDKVYEADQGIYHWKDLREMLMKGNMK